MRIEAHLERVATRALAEALELEAPALLKPTQDAKHGDYQVNGALPLAKTLRRPPRELANALAERLAADEAIASVEVAGPGFVNLTLDDRWLEARLAEVLADRERDGVPAVESPQTLVVDFSSPNIAKQMHVGHLRSTIIGAALVSLLRFLGHRVIGDNHLGDWGTQFGLLLVGMADEGDAAALEREPMVELERVYKWASAKAKEDEDFAARARAALAKLQTGDAESLAQWERFVDTTRRSLEVTYERLGVSFDTWRGESAYDAMLPGVVEALLERGIAREDQGAICVFFSELEGAPEALKKQEVPYIVRKKDGAYLYSTTDVATILYRRDELGADGALYVVDSRQGPHFQQLFAVARALGVEMSLEHIGFGMVQGKDGRALKTRDGGTVLLSHLLDEAEQRAKSMMVDALSMPEDEADALAATIGIGAVKYADLSQNRSSDYRFDWDKLITLKGNSSPYLQYAHARVASIFRSGSVDPSLLEGPIHLQEPTERTLGRRLIRFGEVVHQAAEQSLPHLLCDHLYALARDYSAFYEKCPVLKAEAEVRASRLALADISARQLRRGLELLGIGTPDRM